MVGRLVNGRLVSPKPSTHPCKYEMTLGSLKLSAWDLGAQLETSARIPLTIEFVGGHESVRALWEQYGAQAEAIIFVVDCKNELPEAGAELRKVLDDPLFSSMPILVLGNKCDLPGAPSCEALQSQLGLFFTTGKGKAPNGQRPVELFMCSAVAEIGYAEGLQWLSEQLP